MIIKNTVIVFKLELESFFFIGGHEISISRTKFHFIVELYTQH